MPLLRLTFALLSFATLLASQNAFSHGYVSTPASRAILCKTGENVNCGSVQYEPQSVEGPDGFPESGPVDGTIAAAGQGAWAPLNVQTANRWQKNSFRSGSQVFTWQLTANHVTKDYRYFMTKTNWNPNQKLTRAAFDLEPFCIVDGGMQKPPVRDTHICDVPARKGYHVILAVWDVGDTAASFYNVIDVQFSGGSVSIPDPEPAPEPLPEPEPVPTPDPNSIPTPDSEPNFPPAPTSGSQTCTALEGSPANDAWCDLNCNRTPSFCPANFCSCTP